MRYCSLRLYRNVELSTNLLRILQDIKKKPPKPGDIFNLILSPKKCRDIPSLREVIQSMADLDSGDMNRIKKAAFELMEKLKVLY